MAKATKKTSKSNYRKKGYTPKSPDERKQEIEELSKMINEGADDILKSGKYEEVLKNMSKFHHYSFRNQMLIYLQNPDASNVASFSTWKKDFNRAVRKGEKSLKILAPIQKKATREVSVYDDAGNPVMDDAGNQKKEKKEISWLSFRTVPVFDVSQVDQIPGLPEVKLDLTTDLNASVDGYEDFIAALKTVSTAPIDVHKYHGSSHGYFAPGSHEIVVQGGMSEAQTVKTMIHEITHSELHNEEAQKENDFSREDKEIQAESVAFIVCNHFGIDTSDYSFGYVAGWAGDSKRIQDNMTIIQKTSHDLIDRIEKALIEVEKNQVKTQEVDNDRYPGKPYIYDSDHLVKRDIIESPELPAGLKELNDSLWFSQKAEPHFASYMDLFRDENGPKIAISRKPIQTGEYLAKTSQIVMEVEDYSLASIKEACKNFASEITENKEKYMEYMVANGLNPEEQWEKAEDLFFAFKNNVDRIDRFVKELNHDIVLARSDEAPIAEEIKEVFNQLSVNKTEPIIDCYYDSTENKLNIDVGFFNGIDVPLSEEGNISLNELSDSVKEFAESLDDIQGQIKQENFFIYKDEEKWNEQYECFSKVVKETAENIEDACNQVALIQQEQHNLD